MIVYPKRKPCLVFQVYMLLWDSLGWAWRYCYGTCKATLKHCKSYATHTIHKRAQCHLCCQDSELSCLIYFVNLWFHRPLGSDCGLVNVNIPTSGAEIGGAFGKSIIKNHSLKMRWIWAECLPSGEAAREIICRYSPRLKRIILLF